MATKLSEYLEVETVKEVGSEEVLVRCFFIYDSIVNIPSMYFTLQDLRGEI